MMVFSWISDFSQKIFLIFVSHISHASPFSSLISSIHRLFLRDTPSSSTSFSSTYPSCNYMFKVDNRNTRKRCDICSKLTIKTSEQHHWHPSGVFIVNFEHISHLVLGFLLLTLSKQMPAR